MTRYWRETLRPFLIIGLAIFSFRSAFADWNDVPTGSMRPTIVEGDRVFVNKVAYDLKVPFTTLHLAEWGAPERGDVITFYSPVDGKRLVKRVIAVPGDRLAMRNGALIVNGEMLHYNPIRDDEFEVVAKEVIGKTEHEVRYQRRSPSIRDFGLVTIPGDTFFVMGDNRDDSFDSRFFGFVSRRQITGKATAVAWSLDRSRFYKPRWERFLRELE